MRRDKSLITLFGAALSAVLFLGACVYDAAPDMLPTDLSHEADKPQLALLDHVLGDYFAGKGAGADMPTTCVRLSPDPLKAGEEQELIVRFVRLAPLSRCETKGARTTDAITGGDAVVVEVYEFSCNQPAQCSAWVTVPGRPATRYAMEFAAGAWRFIADSRVIAQ